MMLIPRVRPNYTLKDLFKALFVPNNGDKYRKLLMDRIHSIYKTKNILLTSSGRASLYWIMKSLPQKKVIIPGYTCMVVIEAAMLAGKNVDFVPTEYDSFNTNDFGEKVDNDTIVIATHQYGLPCDIEGIVEKCHRKGAVVIEDCAAALGSLINGKPVGTFGDFAIFSFDPSKMITTPPKGGFLLVKDDVLYNKLKTKYIVKECTILYKLQSLLEGVIYCLLKNNFIYSIFHYITMGKQGKMQLTNHSAPNLELSSYYKFGFYEWQAVIALRQFEELDTIINKRKEVFSYYDKYITNCKVLKPIVNENSACIRYTIKVKDKYNAYIECIRNGVDIGFSFNHISAPKTMAVEHQMAEEIMNLPYYYGLSLKEMEKVVRVINKI